MKDALGNEIKVGKWYGYSVNARGFTKTIACIVKKINPEKVTVDIKGVWVAELLGEMQPMEDYPKIASVRANRLFSIKKSEIGYGNKNYTNAGKRDNSGSLFFGS